MKRPNITWRYWTKADAYATGIHLEYQWANVGVVDGTMRFITYYSNMSNWVHLMDIKSGDTHRIQEGTLKAAYDKANSIYHVDVQ